MCCSTVSTLLPSLPKSLQEVLCVRRGICHLIYLLNEKGQRVVSDILPCSGRCYLASASACDKEAPEFRDQRFCVKLTSWALHRGGRGS